MDGLGHAAGIQWGNADKTHGQVVYAENMVSNLVVLFYVKSVVNEKLSMERNYPVNENVTFVKMHPPGERLNIIDRPAHQGDKNRFPEHWKKFVEKVEQVPEGAPVALLFPNNPATADMLVSLGIYTIEQLANLSAHAMDTVGMGSQEYKTRALAFLDSAKSGANFHKIQKALEESNSKNRVLEQKLALMQKQIDLLVARDRVDLQPDVPNYDGTADRINNTHPSKEMAAKRGRKAVTVPSIEAPAGLTDLPPEPV